MRRFLIFLLFSIIYIPVAVAQNAIVIENGLAGNPISEWGVPDFRDTRVNGFATEISVNKGQTVFFKIHSQSAASVNVTIYRLGYYNGNGARRILDLGSIPGQSQPSGLVNAGTGLYDCSNWSISTQWTVPTTAVSGVYIAKLTRSGGGSNHIIFIVRDDNGNSDILFQMTDATWQAYNGYGGNYLYAGSTGFPNGRAVKVSYNRPIFPYNSGFQTDNRQSDWYMNAEYPMIRWIERNGYNVSYTSCVEVARQGSLLLSHKIFMSAGHDEYWSKEQRDHVEAARNAGVHCAFFTGNEVYWKTRWESDAAGNPFHTLVCYKEGTMGDGTISENVCGYKCDPLPNIWTGLWRTGGNYDAGRPENSLTGQISWVETNDAIQVPSTFKNHRFWRNTSIASMSDGQVITLAPNTLGYEWDQEQYLSNYPEGRMKLSFTNINGKYHHLSLYRHSSRALVFGAGTVQWSWGLDNNHYGGTTNLVSREMQQATVNVFADMDVQPGSLQSDLIGALKSTDSTPPATTITFPQSGSAFLPGSSITITGTCSDNALVTVVEISLDAGNTWVPVNGTTTWSYNWTPATTGSYTVLVRGWDDSGNKGIPGNPPAANAIFVTIGTVTTPPTVLTHPQSQTVCEGATVTFSSTVSQSPQPAVQWQVSDNNGISWSNITGATSASFTFMPVAADNGKYYRAVWTNSVGTTTTNPAILTVKPIPAAPTGSNALLFCFEATVADLFANGTSIKWYSTAIGGSPLIPSTVLENQKEYYASQTMNGCESADRFKVKVSVNISVNTYFFLDGERSKGSITGYQWSLVSGPNVPTIQNPTSAKTKVSGVVTGTYIFNLSLNNGASQSLVLVHVNPSYDQLVVHAGYDREIFLPQSTVALDGYGSYGPILRYNWSKVSGPAGGNLTNTNSVSATASDLTVGEYAFELLITDSNEVDYRDTVKIKVNPAPLPVSPIITQFQSAIGNRNTVVNTLNGVPAGSLLVLSLSQADDLNSGLNPVINSTPALNWTKRVSSSGGLSGNAAIWTAIFSAGGNISVSSVWGIEQMSCVLYAINNFDTAFSGKVFSAANQTVPNIILTPAKQNSLLLAVSSDWNAVDGNTRKYRGGATEVFYNYKAGIYGAYHYRKIISSTGADTLGLSSPTGMSAGTAIWEITGPVLPPTSPLADAGTNQTIFIAVPPKGDTIQSFCGTATVSGLRAIGTGISWYASPQSTDKLSLQQPLVDKNRYYASQVINGCETNLRLEVEALIVNPPKDTSSATICFNELPYWWRGKLFSMPGIYVDTVSNPNAGCDSVVVLILEVRPPISDSTRVSVCSNDMPFLWNGKAYAFSGVFNDTVPGVSGCDTLATLILEVNPLIPDTTRVNVCSNDLPFLWNGKAYAFSGVFNDTVPGVSGCDTLATLILEVNPLIPDTTRVNVCSNDLPFLWNGKAYAFSGVFNDTVPGVSGCDTLATLMLEVSPLINDTVRVSVCSNDLPFLWKAKEYAVSGVFNDTVSSIIGCDTLATLILEVNPLIKDTVRVNICSDQLPFRWNDKDYLIGGAYEDTIETNTGCDTLRILLLTINTRPIDSLVDSVCVESLPYVWYGQMLYETGTYYDSSESQGQACNPLKVLRLTVLPFVEMPIIDTLLLCNGDYLLGVPAGGQLKWSTGDTATAIRIEAAGVYSVKRTDVNGCSSSDSILLSDVNKLFKVTVLSQLDVRCFGDSSGGFNVSAQGGSMPYWYSTNNLQYDTIKEFSGLPAGSYKMYVKDSANCVTQASIEIRQPDSALAIRITRENVQVHGAETGIIIMQGVGGVGGYRYTLNNSDFVDTGVFERLQAGIYQSVLFDKNGCQTSQLVTIEEPDDDLSCTGNTWLGETSSAWEEPLNWSCGKVPTSNSNVIIPSNTSFKPVIQSHVVINSVWMRSNALLRIQDGFSLKVRSATPVQ